MRDIMNEKRKTRENGFEAHSKKYIDKITSVVLHYFLSFVLGGIATTAVFLLLEGSADKKSVSRFNNPSVTKSVARTYKSSSSTDIRTLAELLERSPEELENIDVGLMNLLCAKGLKGAEDMDVNACMTTLDEWAKTVGADVEKLVYKYREHPEQWNDSEPMFRMVTMCYGLKHLFNIHYNLDNMTSMDYTDSSQIFIHGVLSAKRDGSCVSLPVACAAVARRLGYPIKLVQTGMHLFLRWEDPITRQRFNIDVACPGVESPPDEEYKLHPRKLSVLELKRGPFLKSMSAAEELAFFLTCRGHCLKDTGRTSESNVAFANAYRFSPDSVHYLIPLAETVDSEMWRLWRLDCKAMGSTNIRYSSYSGFKVDPKEMTWTFPPIAKESEPRDEPFLPYFNLQKFDAPKVPESFKNQQPQSNNISDVISQMINNMVNQSKGE